jgi:hypothetical protein
MAPHAGFGRPAGSRVSQGPLQSAATIKCHDEEGRSGFFTPYVLKAFPVNLWERDVLQGMRAILCSPNSVISI